MTLTIVCHSSVVSELEDPESAVRSAAQRDSVISSIPGKMRTKLVNAALSLISDEGVTELRHFLHDARATGTE
jgi:hypothetical protein